MKRFSLAMLLLCAFAARAADVRIRGAAVYQTIGRGLTWASGVNQNFILDVISPSTGMCLNVRNTDVSTHTYTVTPVISSDLAVLTFTGNTGAWTSTQISPSNSGSTLANSTDNFFINTSGAAHVVISISGGSGAGAADISIAQTSNQCGTGGVGSIGQAVSCNKDASVIVVTATTSVLVASPPAGQFIHVCAYTVSGASATGATHQFATGSAGACASSTALWALSSSSTSNPMQFALGAGIGQLFQTHTAAQPLCFTNGGSGAGLIANVSYTIF